MAGCKFPKSILRDGELDLEKLGPSPYISVKAMTLFTTEERRILTCVYSVIIFVGLVANVCVIFCITKRKNRYIQKTSIISLAASDLLALISMGINNLETFSHPMINWTLGEFMCGAIPALQVYGILASSFSLLMIAMDRYRNVVHAMNKQWNPTSRSCLIGAVILWISCGAISYPMSTYFNYRLAYVVSLDDDNKITSCNPYNMCVSLQKSNLMKYHLSLTMIIFVPILTAFIWFYYNIALLIWRHRKPVSSASNKKSVNENSMTKSTEVAGTENGIPQANIPKKRNLHVERKIRTLKIIITLLLVFIACRLPYWIYFALKNYFAELQGHWAINYTMIGLSLLNCALNPFLYTFLRPTISSLSKIMKHVNQFLCQVCCCCLSDEDLDEFDKDDKHVGINYVQKKPKGQMEYGKYVSNSNHENSENSEGNNENIACNKY